LRRTIIRNGRLTKMRPARKSNQDKNGPARKPNYDKIGT